MKDGVLRVLSPICPHLGCSIPWVDAKHQFICPCHTAIFASMARVFPVLLHDQWTISKARSTTAC